MDKIKDDFIFLDPEGIEVMKNDESDYEINDIIKDKSIKLKKIEKVSIASTNEESQIIKSRKNKNGKTSRFIKI